MNSKKHSFLQRVSRRYGSSNKVNNLDDLVYYARIEEDIIAKSRSSENFSRIIEVRHRHIGRLKTY